MEGMGESRLAVASEMATQIGRVASRLFATHGYDATSVRMIVEEAGVTKPTLYYHFGSKEGLAQALLIDPLHRLAEELVARGEREIDPTTALVAQVEAHFGFMREDADRSRLLYAMFFGPLSSSLSSSLAGFGERLIEAIRASVDRMVAAGVLEGGRSSAFLAACRGVIVIYTMGFLYHSKGCLLPGEGMDDATLARSIVDDLIRGFGAVSRPLPTAVGEHR